MEKSEFVTPLSLPPVMDLTREETGYVEIVNTEYKFSPEATKSGTDPLCSPIFGTIYHVGKEKVHQKDFGLPAFKFKQGKRVKVRFTNRTGYSFDLHWHGLNTSPNNDGASEVLSFGVDTAIGEVYKQTLPAITNNSCLLWVHAHPMFIASAFVYTGIYGPIIITDEVSKHITDLFDYGDNYIPLIYEDVDFDSGGRLDNRNLYTDAARSTFGLINGISCINWYKTGKAKYTTKLNHVSSKNLVKIDVLNGSCSFRTVYLGICDKHKKIKSFMLVQTDDGFRNPTSLTMLAVAPANRISILVDLNDFTGEKAYVFFYNFDLTEVFDIELGETGELVAQVQDVQKSSNPTPNPTPIPGSDSQLTYPVVAEIPQVTEIVPGGNQIDPRAYTIKLFLEIELVKCDKSKDLSPKKVVKEIRKLVFGEKNYKMFKNIIEQPNFEYSKYGINYITLLNPNYFHNLPDLGDVPTRNLVLFPDNVENANYPDGNPLGATECINGANRIIVDLWNSDELDLAFALANYNQRPNNYKPDNLPTCLFKIFPSNDEYINYNMTANDTLVIQVFSRPVRYGEKTTPLVEVTLIFPATDKPLNIERWINLVNSTFAETIINIGGFLTPISKLIKLDWTFYPYQIQYLTDKVQYLKSVLMKNLNESPYYIRLIGSWQLLQFFGKPVSADMGSMNMGCQCGDNCDCSETKKCSPSCTCGSDKKCSAKESCCSETPFSNNHDMNIQMIFPQWATEDPENPIFSYNGQAELIIAPNGVYYGPIDGFENDNLMNFSVQKNKTENWIYHNMDTQDTHPLHFHLTSGFVNPMDPKNSRILVDNSRPYDPYLYSRDNYAIGSQQSLSFYLKFDNYSSEDAPYNPPIKHLGYMYHCHYMTHHDMNMMGEYSVYVDRDDYFKRS